MADRIRRPPATGLVGFASVPTSSAAGASTPLRTLWLREQLTRTYLTFDARSLALGRIALALVLIVDLARRVPWLRDLYTNAGLLPNHTMLWRPWQPRQFSFLFMASLPEEAAVIFVVSFFCFFCLLVGWHTRLFHLLSFAMTTSLHERNLIAENGGTVALATLMLWTAFLPLGRRFSVDALLASLRSRPEQRPGDLGQQGPADRRPVVSLAVLAVLLQLSAIYWFNHAHKSGATWKAGTAVHYVLHQERIVTTLGVWAREHLPLAATKALTRLTLGIEACAPALLLTPVFWRATRTFAIALLTGLHIGFALLINLGIFSWAMIAYFPLLIDASIWDWLARRSREGHWRLAVFYDASRDACLRWMRTIARTDPESVAPWRAWLRIETAPIREFLVGVSLVVMGVELSVANDAVPEAMRWRHRPEWMSAMVTYSHTTQGWSMFSPDAPFSDMMVVVDAVTRSGRHVDPYNEVGSRVHTLPVDDIPVRLDHDSMFCDYTLQIPHVGAYHQALLEWILRYPERTGNPNDAIVSFEAIKLEHTSPTPGETQPTDVRRSVFLKWP
jgi:hypothetical protein